MTDHIYTLIEVDGIPVEVDADQYGTSPEAVIAQVREARAEVTGVLPFDEAPDYDTLVGAFGEDDTTEVPDAGE